MTFKISCPHCHTPQYAQPSILQVYFGMLEYGRGRCLTCHKNFRLTLSLDENKKPIGMIASNYQRLEEDN
jgi:hypothetical protein